MPWARKLVRDSYDLQEIMAYIHEKIAGHLRIACSTTTGKYILPQFAARFHKIHPGVKVSVMSCTSAKVVPQLPEEDAQRPLVGNDVVLGQQKHMLLAT